MPRRVLVATDDTGSDEPLRWAADWARREGADLVVARVEETAEVDGESPHVVEADQQLTDRAHHLVGDRGRGVVIKAADGAEGLVHYAADQRCELIVCGNTGMHGRREFLLHNLPNRISHLAHCSVVLVNTSHVDEEPAHPHFHHHRPAPNVHVDPSVFEGMMLGRAAEIGRLVSALGAREMVSARRHRGDLAREARILRESLEKLGPTFEKLGQMMSTRPDLLSQEFIDELSTLQDDVPPLPHADVVHAMEQELHVPWEDVFASIEADPIAAGTIAQVHRAVLANGER
ncbi:MAG: universal stress protein, partial [Candidatus Dormibacteraeota bacterium]|nr:universal stress protein [Candidatus Dormibacteraeota bacterium]